MEQGHVEYTKWGSLTLAPISMDGHITKRAMDEELDNDDQPMTDEFEDITYLEKERDEYGAIIKEEENPSCLLDSSKFFHAVHGSLPQTCHK